MTNPLLGTSYRYNQEAGIFVHSAFERAARMVHEYDEHLHLCLIPPQARTEPEEEQWPYMVIDDSNGLQLVSLFEEKDLVGTTILEFLMENDFRKHSPNEIWDKMQAKNIARQVMEAQAIAEEAAEKWEEQKFILRSPLNTINLGGGRKLRT